MDINASIVDMRLSGIVKKHSDWLPKGDEDKKKSAAFVIYCISIFMDIELEEAAELLTDGGNDAGVDGLHIGEVIDDEFTVTLFQCKYKKKLEGDANFPANEIIKTANTVATLFDPKKKVELNALIKPKIEEIRSLISDDGFFPAVRVVLCNNGLIWNNQGQKEIEQSPGFGKQVSWIHFNHDDIVSALQSSKPVSESIRLNGQAIIEDFNFRRVLVGKVPVTEIAKLFNKHGNFLLERNIRRYLGMHANRVNAAIHTTLTDTDKRDNFYFFNNGITMICSKFSHNALQGADYQVKIEGMQVINGGQTCKTIQQTLKNAEVFDNSGSVYVLLRLYELAEEDRGLVHDITYATNSQNPVDLRDLGSNDEIQKKLETGITTLGYTYRRHREEGKGGSSVIKSSVVAESVLAIWRAKPHQAKFMRKEHFGKLYEEIFTDLNPAQAIFAVLIFRYVENERKRPSISKVPDFLPYASHYIAMLMAMAILQEKGLSPRDISHKNFAKLCNDFEVEKEETYRSVLRIIPVALKNFYGERKISLQQLSATFRRGDLLEIIKESLDKQKICPRKTTNSKKS